MDKKQIGWLIERPNLEWLCSTPGQFGWTKNASNAIKFADEQSGLDLLSIAQAVPDLGAAGSFVCEHSWPDGGMSRAN